HLEASLPEDGATNVATDSRIAVRFSAPMRVQSVNAKTANLTSVFGAVEAKIIPAEAGMLGFVTPRSLLAPGNYLHAVAFQYYRWRGARTSRYNDQLYYHLSTHFELPAG